MKKKTIKLDEGDILVANVELKEGFIRIGRVFKHFEPRLISSPRKWWELRGMFHLDERIVWCEVENQRTPCVLSARHLIVAYDGDRINEWTAHEFRTLEKQKNKN